MRRRLTEVDPVAADIELFLLERRGWVSVAEICARFNVPERSLRQDGARPGLCTEFAISSSIHGLKHVSYATTEEWLHSKHTLCREAFARLRRVKTLRYNRAATAAVTRAGIFEPDTGQRLMQMEGLS